MGWAREAGSGVLRAACMNEKATFRLIAADA
jgi:hypothetical protein